jgi:FkbM family methyltransferase
MKPTREAIISQAQSQAFTENEFLSNALLRNDESTILKIQRSRAIAEKILDTKPALFEILNIIDILYEATGFDSPEKRTLIRFQSLEDAWSKSRDVINSFIDKELDHSFDSMSPTEIIDTLQLNKDSVVVDLGTFVGEQITDLADLGAEVHAFEPHPVFSEKLKVRFSNYDNVTINCTAAAAMNNEDQKLFYKGKMEDFNGGASLLMGKVDHKSKLEDKMGGEPEFFHASGCIDIAEYIEALDRPVDLLKIDVEGLEYTILGHLIASGAINKIKTIFFADHSEDFVLIPWFNTALVVIDMLKKRPDITKKIFYRHAS